MSIHDGHRDRLKRQFAENGLDSFNDHTILELLLFYSIPRQDTNTVAHELINHFGSLEAVFDSTEDELKKVCGVGENTATLIRLIPAIAKRCAVNATQNRVEITSAEDAGAYLVPRFLYERDEVLIAICLDARRRIICCKELSRGVVNNTEVSVRKITELALAKNAVGIIIAHNHTGGFALPSSEDEFATDSIKKSLKRMNIELIDHIIVAGDDFISMKDSGYM